MLNSRSKALLKFDVDVKCSCSKFKFKSGATHDHMHQRLWRSAAGDGHTPLHLAGRPGAQISFVELKAAVD